MGCFLFQVFLDDLPEEFAEAVNEYNRSIQEIFGCFFLSASKHADMLEECQLPLSKTCKYTILSLLCILAFNLQIRPLHDFWI